MEILTLFKINKYYPDRCAIVDMVNTKTKFYSASLYTYEKGELGELIYELPRFDYKSPEEAVHVLKEVIELMVDGIKVMSN